MRLGYNSIFEILRDVPLAPVILSLIVALIPLAIYRLWKAPSLGPSFDRGISFLYRAGSAVRAYSERKELDERTNAAYTRIAGRKLELKHVTNSSIYLAMLLVIVLVLKQALFFGLVTSWSMAPTIMPTELVLIESLTKDNVEVGDIVVYSRSQGHPPIIHRVVSVSGGSIRTKGDNGPIDSWTVSRGEIEGKAVIFNGNPVVIKNIGKYFIKGKTIGPSKDPTFELIKNTVQTVHIYGPVILALLLLFVMLGSFRAKKAYV